MRYVCRTGPTWLTKAFQAAGAIPPDVTVSAITKWVELFPNGDPNETRGDGGAAFKVIWRPLRSHPRLAFPVWPPIRPQPNSRILALLV
jgi:hypothetical protein